MGFFDDLFGGGQEEAYRLLQEQIRKGMNERRFHEGRAESALSPYLGDPRLQKQFESAISSGEDPGALIRKYMGEYEESPWAKYQTEAGKRAIQHAAAASGMHLGSDELRNLEENAQGIASKDMGDWLNRLLGIRSEHLGQLGGLAQRESEQGFGARTNIGNWRNLLGAALSGDYQNIGQAQAAERMAQANALQNLFGAGASLLSGGLGGIGGALGRSLFGGGANSLFGGWNMG